jgi:hypothetical protein
MICADLTHGYRTTTMQVQFDFMEKEKAAACTGERLEAWFALRSGN